MESGLNTTAPAPVPEPPPRPAVTGEPPSPGKKDWLSRLIEKIREYTVLAVLFAGVVPAVTVYAWFEHGRKDAEDRTEAYKIQVETLKVELESKERMYKGELEKKEREYQDELHYYRYLIISGTLPSALLLQKSDEWNESLKRRQRDR